MESRAKQRLTGAIILVALFVLLVPELLTGPRNAHPDSAAPDQGMRRYTIDLDAQKSPTAANSAANAPLSLPPVATQNGATTGSAAANDATTSRAATNGEAPERALPGEAAAPEPAPAPAVAQGSAANPGSPVAHQSAVSPPQPARAETVRPVAAPVVLQQGAFAVQLGTFGKRENADRLARDMTAKGFAAVVVPTNANGHELYRVRVGPARDRASAEALAKELKRVGQTGSVVPIS